MLANQCEHIVNNFGKPCEETQVSVLMPSSGAAGRKLATNKQADLYSWGKLQLLIVVSGL
jgi:hypothetical protein